MSDAPTNLILDVDARNPEAPPSPDGALGARRASYNPATGQLLGHVALVGREGIEAAIASAREAQRTWAARTPQERAATLRQFQHVLVEEMDAVARLISMEQGKPVVEALSIEVLAVLVHLRWLTSEGTKLLEGQRAPAAHPLFAVKQARYQFEPLGVIAVISPWNYPFAIPTVQVLTALLGGNGVVFKPSPFTPLVAQKIAELARQSGLPAGLLQVIHVEDADAPHLTGHPGVDKIIFTGSAATGRKVMASAAQVPTPVVLELGGKDAAIVAPDADLKRAAHAIVWYGMANAGQTCASVERVYVHSEVYDRFVDEVVRVVDRLRVGEGTQEGSEVGPMTNERQLRIVEEHIEDARRKGARVLVGGQRVGRQGLFYAPTVLVDVTPEMRIMREETFGPVLPIARVASLAEAVRQANALPYGLVGSVWTGDTARGAALAEQVRAGAVNVNDHAFHFGEPSVGWGGVGGSGFGRTHGVWGLMEVVNAKYISTDARRGALEPWWYPYNEQSAHLLRNAARFLYGPTGRRPWALLSLLLNPRTWQRMSLWQLITTWRRWV